MRKTVVSLSVLGGSMIAFVMLAAGHGRAAPAGNDDSRIREGLRMSPVKLNMKGRDRDLVGLGSYLVNAVGGCNDCHTCPSYAPGHNPYDGGDGKTNSTNYLAGGTPFFPPGVYSANLTPARKAGLPEQGHTFQEFKALIRTGRDADEGGRILQVMPWPVYRNMSDHDLEAIFEFLRAIPPAPPGNCMFPGQ